MNCVVLTLFVLFVDKALCDVEIETTTKSDRFCRERERPVTSDRDDLFNLAEVVIGEKITLQCHFCRESDDGLAKNWFKMDKLNDSKEYEVLLGAENNMSLNRMHLDMEHSLIIHNVTEDDAGEYFCRGLEDEDVVYKYNFFVDIIQDTDITPETGNLSMWKKYHDEQYTPINQLLSSAVGPEYALFKDKLDLNLELVTEWDAAGPCEICGRPKGDGRRKKKGHCRFKIIPRSNTTVLTKSYNEKILLRASHLSCRSIALRKLVPGIMNKTGVIPDFIDIQKCDGTCNPDAEGAYKGWKSTKKSGYKYRKTFVLAEDAHLTIICPESTLENKVVWKTNGIKIKPGESVESPSPEIEPRVTVDSFNTLYLYGVTKEEEGNYTCHVDDVRMQLVRVFVVSKAKLLTQAFFRHMMYLAFVLSLTLSCYCAGLVITWFRRKTFKTYEEVREELDRKKKLALHIDDSQDVEKGDADETKKLLSSSAASLPKMAETTDDYDSSPETTDNQEAEQEKEKSPKYFSETTTSELTPDSGKKKRVPCLPQRKKKHEPKKKKASAKPGDTKKKKKDWSGKLKFLKPKSDDSKKKKKDKAGKMNILTWGKSNDSKEKKKKDKEKSEGDASSSPLLKKKKADKTEKKGKMKNKSTSDTLSDSEMSPDKAASDSPVVEKEDVDADNVAEGAGSGKKDPKVNFTETSSSDVTTDESDKKKGFSFFARRKKKKKESRKRKK